MEIGFSSGFSEIEQTIDNVDNNVMNFMRLRSFSDKFLDL